MDDNGEFAGTKARSNVDYMLRTAQQSFTQLSVAADQKANILIGSTIIMVPLVLGTFTSTQYPWTMLALAASTICACAVALLGIMPRLSRTRSGVSFTDGYNPLFFTEITRVKEEEYLEIMQQVMSDDRLIYQSIVRDLYRHGRVLQRKYRYLRLAYRFFFAGLLTAFFLFLAEFLGLVV